MERSVRINSEWQVRGFIPIFIFPITKYHNEAEIIFLDSTGSRFWRFAICTNLHYGYSGDDGIYAYFNGVTQKGLEELTELFKYGSMNFIQINQVNMSIYRPSTLLTFAVEHQVFG